MLAKYSKLIAVAVILALSVTTYFTHQWYKGYRMQQAEQKWQDTQAYANEMGVELDLNTYIDSRKGEGISLIDDHTWFREIFANTDDTGPKPVELPAFNRGLPPLGQDHEKNILEIRKSLKIDADAQLSDQEVIQRFLTALQPCNEELDRFKAAVMESTDWGTALQKERMGFTNASVIRAFNDRLLIRGYCLLILGSEDTSDFAAACKFHNLYTTYSPGTFIDISVQIAIKLQIQSVANAYAYSPDARADMVKQLIQLIPSTPHYLGFKQTFRAEIAFAHTMMNQMKNNQTFTDSSFLSKAQQVPDHIFLDMRSDLVRFFIDHIIRPKDSNLMSPTDTNPLSGMNDPKIRHLKQPSRNLISIMVIGLEHYYLSCLKSDMLTSIQRLALATQAYQLEHGTYPVSLDSLIPKYINKIPTIPHNGQAYKYMLPVGDEGLPNFSGSLIFGGKQIEVNWLYPVEDKY